MWGSSVLVGVPELLQPLLVLRQVEQLALQCMYFYHNEPLYCLLKNNGLTDHGLRPSQW